MKKVLAALVCMLLISGCAVKSLDVKTQGGQGKSEPKVKVKVKGEQNIMVQVKK